MKNHTKLSICAAILVVPLIILAVCGALFAAYEVPHVVDRDRAHVRNELSAIAEGLREGSVAPDFVWKYRTGVISGDDDGVWRQRFPSNMTWKAWNPYGKKASSSMWGWRSQNIGRKGAALVWTRKSDCIFAKMTDVDYTDWTLISWIAVYLMSLCVAVVTIVPIWAMRKYAKSRDDFLAAAAHDLNTPLVCMRRLIGVDDEEALALNERLLRIVKNIGLFLRMGGERKYDCEMVDMVEAYRMAYRTLEADFRDKFDGDDVELEVPGEPPIAWCEEQATVQALWNLLSNELKYAVKSPRVKARIYAEGSYACVEISDFGPGMRRRDMKRVFDRYWQATAKSAKAFHGFGLGLCTSREAVRSMGGDITLARNEPNGSVFTLRLPLAVENAQ